MDNLWEVLTNLGYTLTDNGREYRTRPIYRESDNSTSLRIRKDTGIWQDFGISKSGTLAELVQITLDLKTLDEAKDVLVNKYTYIAPIISPKPLLKSIKKFDQEFLKDLIPDHSYWVNRGISEETVSQFKGGVMREKGKMANRYVFPIFNSKEHLIGVSGRDLTGKSKIKWKHQGQKSEWKYPLQVNYDGLKDFTSVILVESIGDMLALWEAGVKNSIVTFGVELSIPLLNLLLKLDPKKITISFNNDENNSLAGNNAASKTKNRLLRHFDANQIQILLPPSAQNTKDWNEVLVKNGKESIKEKFV
jgi:hypothetical protein